MVWKKQAHWDLYHVFENGISHESDSAMKQWLSQFDLYDFLSMPIVFDLISGKKMQLLKWLYHQNMPLIYKDSFGGNALHVACGANGSLESVKFFLENNLLQDINKKSLKYGDTPLTLAISYRHADILSYFQKKLGIDSLSLDDMQIVLERMKTLSFTEQDVRFERGDLGCALEELKMMELTFHSPERLGKNKQEMADLVCDGFYEVEASGKIYTKDAVIEA